MFFPTPMFTRGRTADTKKRQILKSRLEAKRRYYSEKINFLTNGRPSPRLALLACRDAPASLRPLTRASSPGKGFVRACAKYYRSQLKKIEAELKKI